MIVTKPLLFSLILSVQFVVCLAQKNETYKKINLVTNGDFEDGNRGFTSDFFYSPLQVGPGQYSITDNAVELNKDFVNPITGDHTFGDGYFLVANSDGEQGKVIWRSEVEVLPNTEYSFSLYFCNLFYLQPSTTSFAFLDGDVKGNDPVVKFLVNGKQIGELDRDFFHLYRWVHTSVIYYSGAHSGKVSISVENDNANEFGNDIALDDISFTYIRTMPEGYVPLKLRTIMSEEYRLEMAKQYKPSKRIINFADLEKGDELSPGVYTIKYRPRISYLDTLKSVIGEKFQLQDLLFNQSDFELTDQSKFELDRLAKWLLTEMNVRLRIEGHTDNVGDPQANILLAQKRILQVKSYLMDRGVSEERLETISFGGSIPIADNSKEETRKLNRRVEFEIIE